MSFVHYLPGGGLGDVYREAVFHNAVGILKRWKNENPDEYLTVLLMSHNPASADLLSHQPWIDEIRPLRFCSEESPDWEYAYVKYPEEFRDKTELRFNIPDRRSLYRAGFSTARPKHGPVVTIPAIGTAWGFEYSEAERAQIAAASGRLVIHFGAGEAFRSVPDELRDTIREAAGDHAVYIGANYARPGHPEETGATYGPRVLASIIARSKGVVGTDSAPCYFASCLGVPRAMIYPPGIAFDKMMNGNPEWDWYFGVKNSVNLFLRTPVGPVEQQQLKDWIFHRMLS